MEIVIAHQGLYYRMHQWNVLTGREKGNKSLITSIHTISMDNPDRKEKIDNHASDKQYRIISKA